MRAITEQEFQDWKQNPVTEKLMYILTKEREEMKEGLVYGTYDEEHEVKGRCRAIANIVNIEYGDLYE